MLKKLNIAIISQVISLIVVLMTVDLLLYLHPIAFIVIWVCTTLIILYVGMVCLNVRIVMNYKIILWCIIFYSICLFFLLFFRPSDQSYNTYNLQPFKTIDFYLSGKVRPLVSFYNLFANIGLFVPFGFFISIRKKYFNNSLILLGIFSTFIIFAIETAQFLTKRGSFDIDDIILNLLGILIGSIVFPFISKNIEIV
ncbi:MAG: VanZ family protein [Bacillales bacterium]|jgi:glycopeptide antibiotics resistance protein|nr:VanZ family protein [Bacillales bacterium]